ncbi:hypothetical protein HQ520_18420, partial [bacterium]|nr:hypothetical protein [bacterium]
ESEDEEEVDREEGGVEGDSFEEGPALGDVGGEGVDVGAVSRVELAGGAEEVDEVAA